MAENEFSEVIASAQKRGSDRAAKMAAHRESLQASIKSKQEVLHGIVNRTLHQAWRDLEAAGVKASVDTGANSRGDWQMALRILSGQRSQALVFTVQAALGAHFVYSREQQTPKEEVDYTHIENATPVEIARIVAEYIADALG
jgi:hypothetical protein